jgi:MFS family permease
MKLSVEKALQACGNNNRYQILLYVAVALTWFSVDYIAIAFPLLELPPSYQCKQESGEFKNCNADLYCSYQDSDRKRFVTIRNILTEFDLDCEKTLVVSIGVCYTLGIVMGAILASKFSDVLGRKPVLLMSHLVFGCGTLAITFAPNIYIILGILFFLGIGSAGGTMVSFLLIYEVLAPNKRSIYGTLINSAFAVAGLIYFTVFKYLKYWKYTAYICASADVISGLLVLTYFTESPRFLLTKGLTKKALNAFAKIAEKNGKSDDFYKYLASDFSIDEEKKTEDLSDFDENLSNTYKEKTFKSSILTNNTENDKSQSNINPSPQADSVCGNNIISKNSTFTETPKLTKKKIDQIVRDISEEEASSSFGKVEGGNREEPLVKPTAKKEAPFSALLKYASLRTSFLICCYLWFAMAFTYYGISMGLKNSGDEVFNDGYVVYTAEGISYMVVGIISSIPFFGRKRSLSIMMLVSSISTLFYFFVKNMELEPYDKILLFLARFGITSIFSIMYTYSTEVYPTVIRAKGLGMNTLFARFASILVPVIVEYLNPFLIFASLCFVGFLLTFFIPETFGKDLEDEIQEEKSMKKIYYSDN